MPHDFDRPLPLEVSVDDHGTTRTVTPCGEMDAAGAGFVARPLRQALGNGFERVVLDLSATTFIDSAGIAVVIDAVERAREHAMGFVVIRGGDEIQRAFDRLGFTEFVPFV